ncbi:DUF4080 domain-containing protein [Bacteroidota bacterium]
MLKILLTTINAKYTHASLGLRYLYANLNELQKVSEIIEFIPTQNINEMAEKLLSRKPKIIGIGVYIWNAYATGQLVNLIKKISPDVMIVLGGPEVSHLPLRVDFSCADYFIQGEGDIEFYNLCKKLLDENNPSQKFIRTEPVNIDRIDLPYEYYCEEDIKNRVIYVEASRGCPFSCEFCLSSIDRSVRYFDSDLIISELEKLWERGVRKFKFVDRTFNLNIDSIITIFDFFLGKAPPYLAHFEVIPDNFSNSLKEIIKEFPPASLQLEIGIQTLNPGIADNISRKIDVEKILDNIRFLANETSAHLHLDLIVGLPGESIESFGNNLNTLVKLTDAEIQIGILKKLSGTTINRHDEKYKMIYSDLPPYEIIMNNLVSFEMMQKMKRFARFWDLIYNSGNFRSSAQVIWKTKDVFGGFYDFSEWLYSKTGSTWQISLNRLAELLFIYLTEVIKLSKEKVAETIGADLLRFPGRKLPSFIKDYANSRFKAESNEMEKMNKRQIKRLK